MLFLVYPSTQPSTKHAFKVQVLGRHNPDSIHVLDQRWQMTFGQRNVVHLPLDGPTSWASVGPMISANNVYNLLTRCQHIFGGNYDGPTLAQYYLPTRYQQMVKINNPVRKMSTSPNRIPVSNGGPPTSFCAKVSF